MQRVVANKKDNDGNVDVEVPEHPVCHLWLASWSVVRVSQLKVSNTLVTCCSGPGPRCSCCRTGHPGSCSAGTGRRTCRTPEGRFPACTLAGTGAPAPADGSSHASSGGCLWCSSSYWAIIKYLLLPGHCTTCWASKLHACTSWPPAGPLLPGTRRSLTLGSASVPPQVLLLQARPPYSLNSKPSAHVSSPLAWHVLVTLLHETAASLPPTGGQCSSAVHCTHVPALHAGMPAGQVQGEDDVAVHRRACEHCSCSRDSGGGGSLHQTCTLQHSCMHFTQSTAWRSRPGARQ